MCFICGGYQHFRHGNISHDSHKDVIEIMRYPASKEAQGFNLLRLEQFLVGPFALGDIFVGPQDSYNLIVCIAKWDY